MSPGATMERVYRELKARAMRGTFAPGERLDPALLARDLGASATPVRDALHRLAGERLIESRHQEGFRQPILTEADLRDLYEWASALLLLALAAPVPAGEPAVPEPLAVMGGNADYPTALAHLFRTIGWLSANRELRFAIANLVERCHGFRFAEERVDQGCGGAIAAMEKDLRSGRRSALRGKIARFHARRIALAGRVIVELRPRDPPLG